MYVFLERHIVLHAAYVARMFIECVSRHKTPGPQISIVILISLLLIHNLLRKLLSGQTRRETVMIRLYFIIPEKAGKLKEPQRF